MTSGAEPLRFSVIVSSWHRPLWLKRCLRALAQLDYPQFEIVVVADAASLANIDHTHLKTVPFAQANLSRARNAGIAASGGDICAFIDDDAVPEPMWLAHLNDAFQTTEAAAVVGYVRGRNGISFQSRVHSVDREAETHTEPDEGTSPFIPKLAPGRALKLVGTNMAIRRTVLVELGGFDEIYRYFLEDADMSLRIADAGYPIAVAPLAEVHHAYAASPRRSALRTPIDLSDIGKSSALFLRRYRSDLNEIKARIWKRERTRLIKHMVLGAIEPGDVAQIMRTLETGWREGVAAPLGQTAEISKSLEYLAFPAMKPGHVVQRSRMLLKRKKALTTAVIMANNGQRVSLFSFSLTPFRHRVRYKQGVWIQTGGLFGRSKRSRSIRWCRFAERFQEESCRVAKVRGIGEKG